MSGLNRILALSILTGVVASANPSEETPHEEPERRLPPLRLIADAAHIAAYETTREIDGGEVVLKRVEVLKGPGDGMDAPRLTLEQSGTTIKADPETTALLFLGSFDAENAPENLVGVLHMGSNWYGVEKRDGGFRLIPDPLNLRERWDDETVSLRHAVDYALRSLREKVIVH